MDFENDIKVDGLIHATETIKADIVDVPITTGATSLADINIDWSLSNAYVIDLRPIDNSGGNINVNIDLINGASNNIKNKIVILQPTTNSPNIANITLRAYATQAKSTSHTIENVVDIHTAINVHGKKTVLEFDFYDNTYSLATALSSGATAENNNYASNNIIVDTESYNQSLSKLDDILGRIAPPSPPYIDDVSVTEQFHGSVTAQAGWLKLSDGTALNNLVFADPTIRVQTFVAPDSTGQTDADVGGTSKGVLLHSAFSSLPQTLSNLGLTLTKSVFNSLYNAFVATIALTGAQAVPAASAQRTLTVNSNGRSVTFLFYRMTQPTLATIPTITQQLATVATIPVSDYVSGIPALTTGSVVTVTAVYNNVSYVENNDGCYSATSGRISGTAITTFNVPSASNTLMAAAAPNSHPIQSNITIAANRYQDNFAINLQGYTAPNGQSGPSTTITHPTNTVLVDSVTNRSLFGINHEVPMTHVDNNNLLMVLNGLVQYPSADYSNYWNGSAAIGAALNYSSITNDRYVEFTLSVTAASRVSINIVGGQNFSNSAIESSSAYAIEYERSDVSGAVYNGNVAYPGTGVVANGGGGLDVAASSQHTKVVTFGEVITATVKVRIILKNGSTHKFSQGTNITQLL